MTLNNDIVNIYKLHYVNQDISCMASPWLQVLLGYSKQRTEKNESFILTALSHMPFEEMRHALTEQRFFPLHTPDLKRETTPKSKETGEKNQKTEVSKCIKGLGAKEERKEF